MFLYSLFLVAAISAVQAQIPCDDAYGQFCPEESGYGVGDCLKQQNLELISEGCINYIQMHDICKDDINTHCPGKEYTGDALGNILVFCVVSVYLCLLLSDCLYSIRSLPHGMDKTRCLEC